MNINTKIIYHGSHKAVVNAIDILRRDMNAVFRSSDTDGGAIKLIESDMPEEQFEIKDGNIYAADDLGFIYGLLHVSQYSLGIPPFWFWYDFRVKPADNAEIGDYKPAPARIRFRGWFLNDEILLTHWTPGGVMRSCHGRWLLRPSCAVGEIWLFPIHRLHGSTVRLRHPMACGLPTTMRSPWERICL